jgi:hypothetical protein
MRSPEDVFEELEQDRASREGEIRLIENVIARSRDEKEKTMLRRSLVLLTYAHLEGFCKFALTAYASTINALHIPCKDASIPLVALTLARVFAALRDLNSKHPEFSKIADDRELHMLARERAFLESFDKIAVRQVEIPDSVVDTKSNLSSIVLKRNLYQLGLRYPIVASHAGRIDRLLGTRNAIAHGDKLKEPKESDVKDYLQASFEVMEFVQREVFESLKAKIYQRDAAADLVFSSQAGGVLQRVIAYAKTVRMQI